VSSHSDSNGMGSIPTSPDALNVPLLLYQEQFNEASLPVVGVDCKLDICVVYPLTDNVEFDKKLFKFAFVPLIIK
jgi:hypothetical protein